MRVIRNLLRSLSVALLAVLIGAVFCLAQESGFSERTIAPSAPAPKASPRQPGDLPAVVIPPPRPHQAGAFGAAAPAESSDETDSETGAAPAQKPALKAHKYFPYIVREGDTLGSISNLFGVPVADIAKLNRLHEDSELNIDQKLKIPNPFESAQKALEAQVAQLSAQADKDQSKIDQLQTELNSIKVRDADLTTENEQLRKSVESLPWWRGTALGMITAALLMLGVTVLTLFEWWMIRRRFIALSDLAGSLGRLDIKYKEMLAKAELRMQQLYGRRRPAGIPDSAQAGAKSSEEIEIERLNHELKETLERHLERLGVRTDGRRRRSRIREMIGAEEEPSVEARLRR